MPLKYRRGSASQDSLFPKYAAGNYYFTNSGAALGTSNTLGNGTLRLALFVVPTEVNITRLGTEFTAAGEAASVFRLGIYTCNAVGRPDLLVLDAGTISTGTGDAGTVATGGTPGLYDITVNVWLARGLYFVGGAVQGAPTTQPTMRIGSATLYPQPVAFSTSPPSAGQSPISWQLTSISGALPAPWGAGGSGISGSTARLHVKAA